MTLKLLFAADGPRDEAALPPLVGNLLGTTVEPVFTAWKGVRLQRGGGSLGGYGRKLLFLLRDARDRGVAGVVATVDVDRDPGSSKLKDLEEARNRDRAAGKATPAALGEAIPHMEAWLLDDDVAVRKALNLASDAAVAVPTKVKSPKEELDLLHQAAGACQEISELLAILAKELNVTHCGRAGHTGFMAFYKEVDRELKPLCL